MAHLPAVLMDLLRRLHLLIRLRVAHLVLPVRLGLAQTVLRVPRALVGRAAPAEARSVVEVLAAAVQEQAALS
jgi:hypothetical protein